MTDSNPRYIIIEKLITNEGVYMLFTTLICISVICGLILLNKSIIFYKKKKETDASDKLLEQDQLRTQMVNKIISSPDLTFISRKWNRGNRIRKNHLSHYILKIPNKQNQNEANHDITISAWVDKSSSIYKLLIDSENAYLYLTTKESKTLQSFINSEIIKIEEKDVQAQLELNRQKSIQNANKLEVIYKAI